MPGFMRDVSIVATVAIGLSVGGAFSVSAGPIMGSLTLSSDGVVDNGDDLLVRSVYTPSNLHVGLTTGHFSLVATGSAISGGMLDLNNFNSFSFNIVGAGTFADGGRGNVLGQRTATNLDVYLLGLFTPQAGGPLAAFDPGASSVRLSLTRTGGLSDFSISFSGTEAAPPASPPPTIVPEPTSLAVLGAGLLGLGLLRRRAEWSDANICFPRVR